jgi:hypothetical protein
MHDNQLVTVTLAHKTCVDDLGHAMLSRWAIIAFCRSPCQARAVFFLFGIGLTSLRARPVGGVLVSAGGR